MGKQILITGTNSYVGTSFKQYIEKKNGNMPLEDRWHVTFVSVRNSEWKKMDFLKYDTILHVAAIVHQKEQPEMEALYYAVNTKLTEELADKAKAERARQFVFLSTMSVYGMTMGQITEETECTPITFYGKSKLAAERYLCEQRSDTFKVAVIRPPMIYGKACTGNYASLEKLAGKIPVFPRVSNERSMIYIENLCEFLYRIIRGDADGIYCPQNSQYVNTSDMVARIAESYGRSIWLVPGFEWIIGKLTGRVNIFSKVFGSLTYDRKLSFPEEVGEYEVVDFLESIKKSKEIEYE